MTNCTTYATTLTPSNDFLDLVRYVVELVDLLWSWFINKASPGVEQLLALTVVGFPGLADTLRSHKR